MPTLSLIVGASADDARNLTPNSTFTATAATHHLGNFSGSIYYIGWRFTGVTIPQGATITSALLTMYVSNVNGGVLALVSFWGEATDNAATFASGATPQNRTHTTAQVNQTFTTVNWGTVGYQTNGTEIPDLATIIQEIVNRPGWASGNALAIVATDNGSTNPGYVGTATWDNASTKATKLDITYTTGSGATPGSTGLGRTSSLIVPGRLPGTLSRIPNRTPGYGGQKPADLSNLAVVSDNEYRNVISWTDNSVAPYAATNFVIERSTDGINYSPLYISDNRPYYIDLTCSPNTQYWYRVTARNSYGDGNVVGPVITTTPAAGQPWTAQIQGWVYPGNPYKPKADYSDGRDIYALKPEYATVNASGVIVERSDPTDVDGYNIANAWSIRQYSQEQYFTVSSGYTNFALLMNSPTNQSNGITTLLGIAQKANFTGVELDMEGYGSWTDTDYTNFKSFVTSLVSTFHANNLKVMVCVPPIANTTNYGDLGQSLYKIKYEEIAPLVDYMCVLAYDYEYDYGAGVPVQPIGWVKAVCEYAINKVGWSNRSKIVIGMPSYGYHGTTGGFSITLDAYKDSVGYTGFSSATRDSESQEMMFTNAGSSYVFSDTVTLNAKRKAIEDMGIQKVSVWYMGGNLWFNGRVEPFRSSQRQNVIPSPIRPGSGFMPLARFMRPTKPVTDAPPPAVVAPKSNFFVFFQ